MTRHELIERNKVLRMEKKNLHEKLSDKMWLGITGSLAHMNSSKINDLRNDMNKDKAWINSEKQTLDSIKRKLASQYDTLNEYNKELEYLYAKKQRAYDCKDYGEVNRIKAQIEGVKQRKSNIRDKINSIKRERDRQANYISSMIERQNERYSKICSLKRARDKDLANYIFLRDERAKLKNRLNTINEEIARNQRLIDSSKR